VPPTQTSAPELGDGDDNLQNEAIPARFAALINPPGDQGVGFMRRNLEKIHNLRTAASKSSAA